MSLESARRWTAAHPEENRARARRWYNATTANADRSIVRSTTWKKAHPESVAEHRRRTYLKANPRPHCPCCDGAMEPRQRTACRRCSYEAKLARTSDWRARQRQLRRVA